MSATSSCRQNYHSNSEAEINKQINLELYASYVYMSMVRICKATESFLYWFHLTSLSAHDYRHIILTGMILHREVSSSISRKLPMKRGNTLKR